MRTPKQILNKIKEIKEQGDDVLGTKREDLVEFLPYNKAKKYLRSDVTKEMWEEAKEENTKENIKNNIKDYLPFAWEKANNRRGISASRSIHHIETWLWLLNDEEKEKTFKNIEYQHYGKEKLIYASNLVDFNYKKYDNGERINK